MAFHFSYRAERDSEKRLRVQAESDARRAKAAADQAAAAAAAASRSLKLGEKQASGGVATGKDGEVSHCQLNPNTVPREANSVVAPPFKTVVERGADS